MVEDIEEQGSNGAVSTQLKDLDMLAAEAMLKAANLRVKAMAALVAAEEAAVVAADAEARAAAARRTTLKKDKKKKVIPE